MISLEYFSITINRYYLLDYLKHVFPSVFLISSQLLMSRTTPYSIPDLIQEIEESKDSSNHPDFLIKLGKRAMMYKDESIYTSLVTGMIYFEEASVSKGLFNWRCSSHGK